MTMWSRPALLAKSRLYFERAWKLEPRRSEHGLFLAVGLEFLGRACLAQINPALLAEMKGDAGNASLMFACGLPVRDRKANVRSIPAWTVYRRCELAIPEFTPDLADHCIAIANVRNLELHTGEAAYESFPPERWQLPLYRSVGILASFLKLDLGEVLPPDAVRLAVAVVSSWSQDTEAEVTKRLGQAEGRFKKLGQPKRSSDDSSWMFVPGDAITIRCPVCNETLAAKAAVIGRTEYRASNEGDDLTRETTYAPLSAQCGVCGLKLDDHAQMDAAGVGGPVVYSEEVSAMDYLGEHDFALDDDYGND